MIVLTSFVEALRGEWDERFSAARWAPDFAREWPVLEFWQPLRDGKPVLLRQYPDVRSYYEDLYEMFREHGDSRFWVDAADGLDVAVCCWCPNTKKAREQIAVHGSMVCHLGAVAKLLDVAGVGWRFGEKHKELIARV